MQRVTAKYKERQIPQRYLSFSSLHHMPQAPAAGAGIRFSAVNLLCKGKICGAENAVPAGISGHDIPCDARIGTRSVSLLLLCAVLFSSG